MKSLTYKKRLQYLYVCVSVFLFNKYVHIKRMRIRLNNALK